MGLLKLVAAMVLAIVFIMWVHSDPAIAGRELTLKIAMQSAVFGFGTGIVFAFVVDVIEALIKRVTAEPEKLSVTDSK